MGRQEIGRPESYKGRKITVRFCGPATTTDLTPQQQFYAA